MEAHREKGIHLRSHKDSMAEKRLCCPVVLTCDIVLFSIHAVLLQYLFVVHAYIFSLTPRLGCAFLGDRDYLLYLCCPVW